MQELNVCALAGVDNSNIEAAANAASCENCIVKLSLLESRVGQREKGGIETDHSVLLKG